MEVVLLLISLCVLAVLALRFGRDSRPSIYSREEQQAAHGLVWNGAPGGIRRRLPPNWQMVCTSRRMASRTRSVMAWPRCCIGLRIGSTRTRASRSAASSM